MLTIDQFRNVQTGETLAGFFVRNRSGKVIATGAQGHFVSMSHKRYSKDSDLVQKVATLTGLSPRLAK